MSKDKTNTKGVGLLILFLIYVFAFTLGFINYNYMSGIDEIWRLFVATVTTTIIIYIAGLVLGSASIYDPYWSIQTPVIMMYYMIKYNAFTIGAVLFFIVLSFWGIRLTLNFCITFTNLHYEDWRYKLIRERCGKKLYWLVSLFGIHLMPTIIVFAASIPVYYYIMTGMHFQLPQISGLIVMVGATLVEMISDMQQHTFIDTRKSKFELNRIGIWKYSRHPNYFGEILFWYGVALVVVVSDPARWFLFAGAVLNTLLFVFISIPLAENHLKTYKADFAKYKKNTRMLFPIYKRQTREADDIILERQSIREFKEDMIPTWMVDKLTEAFMSAPSSCNKKPAEVYLISNQEVLEKLKHISPYARYKAPFAMVACANKERFIDGAEEFFIEDCSASVQNVLLMAEYLHLGAVWCGVYPVEKFMNKTKDILELKDNLVPFALIYIGFPKEEKKKRPKEGSWDRAHRIV